MIEPGRHPAGWLEGFTRGSGSAEMNQLSLVDGVNRFGQGGAIATASHRMAAALHSSQSKL